MSTVETAIRLAEAANTQRVNLKGMIEQLKEAHHLSIERLTAELEPLARAMAALSEELRQSMAAQQKLNEELGLAAKSALTQATRAGEILEKSQRWIRWKIAILLLVVAWGSAGLGTIGYSNWQQRSLGHRQDASRWQEFLGQWGRLTAKDQGTIQKLLNSGGR